MSEQFALALDLERCQSHGMCAAFAPDIFDQDDDTEQAVLRVHVVAGAQAARARTAADSCPELAIRLTSVVPPG